MRFPARLLAGLPCLASMACGSLSVDVAVLDPTVLQEARAAATTRKDEALLRVELPRILALTGDDVERVVDEIAQDHFDFYVSAGELLRNQRAAAELQDDFNEMIRPRYDTTKAELKGLLRSITELEAARRQSDGEENQRLAGDIILALRRWEGLVRELRALAQRDIASLREHLAEQRALAPAQEHRLAAQTEDFLGVQTLQLTLLSTATLDADPRVAAVAGAEKDDWLSQFHRVFGRGHLGAFNMAIKMEKGPSEKTFPEFTLKGLTFDPSDVARMASRVTSQALALGARMAGVPLSELTEGSDPPPAGTALTAVTSPLATKQAEVAAEVGAARTHDAALQRLAVAILQSWDDLTSSEAATRKAAIIGLRATFEALQPDLRTATAPLADESSDEEEPENENPAGEAVPEESPSEGDDGGGVGSPQAGEPAETLGEG